jgi:endonuclease-3
MFRRFRQANPAPRTELQYQNPFELLIAVILSAQATDVSVNKATARFFPLANTPRALLQLGVEGIIPYIRTIGLFNTKARNIMETCRILCERHDGDVPANREALEALPGVGRKTANVVLNTAFGQSTMAVDTHIFRVSNRTGLAPGKTVLDVERKLLRLVPREFRLHAHHWLILHGRYVCLARTPACSDCLIRDLCDYKAKTQAGSSAKSAGITAASRITGSNSRAVRPPAGTVQIRPKQNTAGSPAGRPDEKGRSR